WQSYRDLRTEHGQKIVFQVHLQLLFDRRKRWLKWTLVLSRNIAATRVVHRSRPRFGHGCVDLRQVERHRRKQFGVGGKNSGRLRGERWTRDQQWNKWNRIAFFARRIDQQCAYIKGIAFKR